MKEKITKMFKPLLLAVMALFIVAAIFSLQGIVAKILLILATIGMLALLLEAAWSRPSFFKYSYRFAIFFGLWTALFYNFGEKVPMQFCGILTLVAVVCVVFHFICYINKYCVKDADERLK